jgi:O-antigen ligase
VLTVRNFRGLALIALMFCLVVYWIKPQLMVLFALFLACASLPEGLHVGMVLGPVAIFAHHVALALAICYLIPIVRSRFSAYLLPGMFALVVAFFAAVGFAMGHATAVVVSEAAFLLEMVGGFVLALFVVYCGYIKESIHAAAVILWFSAGMVVASSLGGIRLGGRHEVMQSDTTAGEATRLITNTAVPAAAVLTVLVAAQVVGRVQPMLYLTLGAPALMISLLSFSRDTLLSMGVAGAVAFIATLSWPALRRTAVFVAASMGVLAVTVPGALFLLQHSSTGVWLGDQFTAFNLRVFGGVSKGALAVDQSLQDRLNENAHLHRAIAEAPVFGHGLGYAYQLPFGNEPDEFTATVGTTYSHNFYLWWLCKAGAVGMAAFAVFALTPIVRALRCASPPAKVSAAVSVGLLVVCIFSGLPEEPVEALTVGLALGAAMGYADVRPTAQNDNQEDADADRVLVPVGRP